MLVIIVCVGEWIGEKNVRRECCLTLIFFQIVSVLLLFYPCVDLVQGHPTQLIIRYIEPISSDCVKFIVFTLFNYRHDLNMKFVRICVALVLKFIVFNPGMKVLIQHNFYGMF